MKFSVLSLVFAVAAVLSGADAKTREVTFPVATPLTYLLDVGTGGSRCQQAEGSCIDLESGRCAHGASNIRAGLCPDPKASVKCCLPTSKLAKAEELGGRKTMVEKFHSGVGSGKRTIEISTKANEVEWVKVDGQRVSHRQDGLELHLGSNDAVISPATLSGLILVENNSKETTRLFWRDMEPSPETALMDGSIMVGLAHEFLDVFANRDSRILAGEDTSLTLEGWKAAAEPAKAAVQADVEEIRAMVQRHGESMTVLLNENSPTMKRIAEMKTVLESVKNAIDDAFTTLAKWSSSVEASFELPLAERENGKFLADAEAEAIFKSDEWTSFRAHLEEEPEAVKPGEPMTLSPRGEEFLKSAVNAATDKYIETLSGMFAQQDRDNGLTMQYGMTTIYTSPEYNWLKSPVGKARSRAAIEEIMRQSPALMNTIASAASVVDNGEEMVQTLLEDITGLFKKQETKETAIADLDAQIDAQGGLDPGQKQIIENFYNKKNEALAASQAADAEAAVEKVGGESEKIKASVKPIFAGLASKVGVAGKLVIPGDKVKTTLDVRAQLNDPLGADPTAELSAKLTFSGTTEGGTSWSAGGGTTAYVSDVYGQQSLDHIKVDWFATARRGAVSTGFFGSVDVPLTERGGSHLLGGAQGGAQLDLSAHITYDITEQTYIRGTAKYTANQAGANLWALGVEGTHQISDNAFLTAGVGVQGGSNEWDRGRTNAAGFGGGTDAYARVGFVIKF